MSFNFDLKIVTGDSAQAVLSTAAGLEATDKGARHAAEGVKLFEGEVGRLSGSVAGLTLNLSSIGKGGPLFMFDLAEGARFAFEAVSKLVEKVVDLGKEMVGAVAGAETLNLAMKLQLGDKGAAEFSDLAELIAKRTGQDDDFWKSAWLPLFKAGLRDKERVADLTAVAADLAAQNNEGQEAIKGYLSSLGRIALGGKIKEGALKDFGIVPEKFYGVIAAAHKTTLDEAAKMLKAGKLSSDEILNVITTQVAANSGNAEVIGQAALQRGQTIDATLQRLKDLPENIFKRLEGSEGMANLKGAIENFITGVEESAPRALATFGRAFRDLFGDISGPDGVEKVKVAIDVWLLKFEAALPVIVEGTKTLLGVMVDLSKVVLEVAEAWPRIKNIFAGAIEGAAAGGAAGFLAGGVGAVPGAVFGGVGGAFAASAGVQFIDPEEKPAAVRRASTSAGTVTTNNAVTYSPNITIHATSAEDAAEQYERRMREANTRIGQELASFPNYSAATP